GETRRKGDNSCNCCWNILRLKQGGARLRRFRGKAQRQYVKGDLPALLFRERGKRSHGGVLDPEADSVVRLERREASHKVRIGKIGRHGILRIHRCATWTVALAGLAVALC